MTDRLTERALARLAEDARTGTPSDPAHVALLTRAFQANERRIRDLESDMHRMKSRARQIGMGGVRPVTRQTGTFARFFIGSTAVVCGIYVGVLLAVLVAAGLVLALIAIGGWWLYDVTRRVIASRRTSVITDAPWGTP